MDVEPAGQPRFVAQSARAHEKQLSLGQAPGLCRRRPVSSVSTRILALVVDAFGGEGGISQYNRDLISAWSALGAVDEIAVLPRFAAPSNVFVPDKVVQHSPTGGALQYSIRAVANVVRREHFDFIFCGHLHMIPLAVVISKLSGVPIWLQLHGIEAWRKRTGLFRWCVEQVNFVTAVSRHTRRQFLRWANVDPNVVLVLPNTIGEKFTPDGSRLTAKETYGLVGKRVLLTVSRLAKSERYKGHERVIRCLPQIAEEIGDLVYVIAGDGDMRCELEDLVRRERLESIVVFTGEVENSKLPALYRAADIFVMPSSGEGFGIVYLEALACGTPVIAGDSDGARDPLQDGNLGVLADEQGLMAEVRCLLGLSPRCGKSQGRSREIGDSVKRYFGREVFNTLVRDATEQFERAAHTVVHERS